MRPLSDDEAWIVWHNMPLVGICLRECLRGRWCDPATRDDLNAAGYLGLCNAVRLYDPENGKWSSYACQFIKRMIYREIADLKPDGNRVSLESHKAAVFQVKRHRHAEADLSADEQCSSVISLLDELTERQRVAVTRLAIHEDKLVDVASDIGSNPSNTLQTKRRALLEIERKLATTRKDLTCSF